MLQFTPSLKPEPLPWAEIIEENPAEDAPAELMPEFSRLTDIEIKALLTVERPQRGYQGIAAFLLGLVETVLVVSAAYLLLRPDDSEVLALANAVLGVLLLVTTWPVGVLGTYLAFCGLRPSRPERCLAALGLALNAVFGLLPFAYLLVLLCAAMLRTARIL